MDTPGLREMQLWDALSGVAQVFGDIDLLAQNADSAIAAMKRSQGARSGRHWARDDWIRRVLKTAGSFCANRNFSDEKWTPKRDKKRNREPSKFIANNG